MITSSATASGDLVRAALATTTGWTAEELGDDVPLDDIGIDSLGLVELLPSISEQAAAVRGCPPAAFGCPTSSPGWRPSATWSRSSPPSLPRPVSTPAADAGTPVAPVTPSPGRELPSRARDSTRPAPSQVRRLVPVPRGSGTSTVTVLFTDVIDSTRILTSFGAAHSDAVRRTHFSALRRAIRHWRGEEIKTTGDGLMVVFHSALDAIECAVAMQRGVALLRHGDPDNPEVRVGLSAGEAMQEAGDWYGDPVVEAARVCAAAHGGQVLVTDVIVMLLGTRSPYGITSVGALDLKGFDAPVRASEVQWAAALPARPLPPAVDALDDDAFVGREVELGRLARAWDRARAGERSLALLCGEPGIGKTRLAAELARNVHEAGGTVLWGRTDENLEVAFQSFAEALRHYVAHTMPEEVAAMVGPRTGNLARLVPDLVGRLPELQAAPPAEGDADRLEMFEAVATLLNAASRSAPVLLVLDDLHWAARGSVLLLRHLVRDRRPARLLIVGTYRDTDLDGVPPVTELLAEVHREPHVEHMELAGLDAASVAALLEHVVAEQRLDTTGRDVTSLVHAETEGNPFFVRQVIDHLREVGATPGSAAGPSGSPHDPPRPAPTGADRRATVLDQTRELLLQATEPLIGSSRGSRWPVSGDVGVPDGVRHVVGRRLSRLTEATNQLLKVAAVMGQEFDLAALERVPEAPKGEALLDAVDEALGARLVRELDGPPPRLAFTHHLVRQTLLEGLSAARRAHLHRHVGEALESLPGAGDAQLVSLAYHFCAGAAAGSGERGAAYAEQAGTVALRQGFFETAVVRLERGLDALATSRTSADPVRARILVALAEAAYHAGDVRRTRSAAAEGAEAARAAGSPKLLARAAWWRAALPMAGVEDPLTAELLQQALDAIGDGDPRLRAGLLGQLALYRAVNEGDGAVADTIAGDAVDFARADGDPTVLARALMGRSEVLLASPHVQLRARLLDELSGVIPQLPPRVHASSQKALLRHRAVLRIQSGDVAGFDEELASLARLEREGGDWFDSATLAMWRSLRALMSGRLQETEAQMDDMIRHAGEEANFRFTVSAQLFQLRREQGRVAELLGLLRAVVHLTPHMTAFRAGLALLCAELGDVAGARAELEPLAADDFAAVPWDVTGSACLALLAETCSLLGDAEHVGCLNELLLPHSGQLVVGAWGAVCLGAADRYLGLVAALEGRLDDAERHLDAALALEDGVGAAPLSARTRCAYAAALFQRGGRGDRQRARRLLQDAADTAEALGAAGLSAAVERTRAVAAGPVPTGAAVT
jgi:class 3 adenylate cyclase/tetratricopeptide (TPR) repeat protein